MFSFQGAVWIPFSRNSVKHHFPSLLISFGASVSSLKEVVGQNGLEPSTSRLSVVCSSQLSYWPISSKSNPRFSHSSFVECLPVSLFLLPHQSIRFVGDPVLLLVESTGIEPVTSCLQGRRSPSWANPPFKGSSSLQGSFTQCTL